MSAEMTVLLLAVILGFIQLSIQALTATSVRGAAWNLSSRDGSHPPLGGFAGRADRAFQNFKETFPFFLSAVFLVMHTERAGNLSAIGAYAYLAGRVVYIPLYLFNVIGFRTAAWAISAVGIALVLVQAAIS